MKRPLPGADAQRHMAPVQARSWPAGFDPLNARPAAALLLVVPRDERAHVVLTLRADSVGRHRGQISLPGGVVDAGETYEQAALREAHEEIGVDTGAIETLGALTPLDIPVSGFRLHPILGIASRRPDYLPAPHEVARVLEAPIARLLSADEIVWRTAERDGRTLDYPAFPTDDVDVWGATAMILAEFLTLLGWAGPATRL